MSRWSSRFPVVPVLAMLVILVSLNLLGMRFFHRWDLTENREFTLSDATRRVLDRADDVITIKAYFSRELPSYFATLDRQVKDLLDEYRAQGGDKVRVEFIDPASDPAVAQAVQMLGIPKLRFSQVKEERAEAVNGYMGIAVEFGDQTEVIPVVQTTDRLEYDLTAAIVKLTGDQKTVGIVAAGGGGVPENLRGLEQILQRQYTVRPVDPAAGPVPGDITTLVVVDQDGLTDEALYRIDQFLMRGGRMLVMASGVDVDLSRLQARDRIVKMGPLLKDYGVDVRSALVVDAQAALVDVGFILPARYPWFPQVIEDGLSRRSPITSEMQSLVLPWVSPLEAVPVDSAAGAAVEHEVLARSSARSYARTAPYDLNPQSRLAPPPEGSKPLPLAMALVGRFPSHWRNGAPVPGDSLGTAPRGPDVSTETQMVVVGTPHLADGRILGQFGDNGVFLANAVDWMTLGDDLISIRSRAAVTRPLKEIGDDKRTLYKMLAMIPVPVLVVLFGLGRARLQRSRRLRDAERLRGGMS